ncbi:MAG: GyrI-like domain-containing protein [Treponema sp.]|jgi:AraC family transcriptional regulator|nr:GyrI-like domain-containing protein [Treponema sp.]
MQLKIVTLPGKRLAGFVCRTTTVGGRNHRDVPVFWRDYLESGKKEKLNGETFVKDHRHYGVWFHENPATRVLEYFVGVEAGKHDPIPPDYEVRELRPASYLVFSSSPADGGPEFVTEVRKTWARIYGEWIPRSGYELNVMACDFELYDHRAWAKSGRVCDIYIPVIPRTPRQ